jgi:hypothetical protein
MSLDSLALLMIVVIWLNVLFIWASDNHSYIKIKCNMSTKLNFSQEGHRCAV